MLFYSKNTGTFWVYSEDLLVEVERDEAIELLRNGQVRLTYN